jgi:hypothetical protein
MYWYYGEVMYSTGIVVTNVVDAFEPHGKADAGEFGNVKVWLD